LDRINRSLSASNEGIVVLTSIIHVAAYQFCNKIVKLFSESDLESGSDSESSLESSSRFDSDLESDSVSPRVYFSHSKPEFNEVEWIRTMNVNVRSIYQINQLLIPRLRLWHGASIVVVGSVHSVASSSGISMYAISKSALVGLVRNSAIEFGPLGVRINM